MSESIKRYPSLYVIYYEVIAIIVIGSLDIFKCRICIVFCSKTFEEDNCVILRSREKSECNVTREKRAAIRSDKKMISFNMCRERGITAIGAGLGR